MQLVERRTEIISQEFVTEASEEDSHFNWSKSSQVSFNTLKDCLTTAPVLEYPDLTQEFFVDTDASAFCIGGVLSQVSTPERNYCVTGRELLAVVKGIKHIYITCMAHTFLSELIMVL